MRYENYTGLKYFNTKDNYLIAKELHWTKVIPYLIAQSEPREYTDTPINKTTQIWVLLIINIQK